MTKTMGGSTTDKDKPEEAGVEKKTFKLHVEQVSTDLQSDVFNILSVMEI